MARIRTVKPEFFTSEDIVALDPFARLLYIALWCEADKEGRLLWRPKTFKMRYFPADAVDIEAMCKMLTDARLVVLYGGQYAHIPQFKKHQHVNPRESASILPDPDASSTRAPRVRHASVTVDARDSDAQGGREGKGKEGKEDSSEPDGSEPVSGFAIPLNDGSEWAVTTRKVAEWVQLFPAVDVEQELREMRAWSVANPTKRKTPRGIEAFAVRWLGKAQDTPGRSVRRGDDSGAGVFV